MADNFSRVGDFENASNILHQYNDALEKAGLQPYPNYVSSLDVKTKEIIEGNLDTGHDISMLTSKYYNRNKSLFADVVPSDPPGS